MNKRIIFDVGHPAQVHNFKYVSSELSKNGWEVLFTAKDKEITKSLLDIYNLPYILIGRTGKNIGNKIFSAVFIFYRYIKILRRFKPGIVICRFSLHACWCSKLLNIPIIGIADTEHTNFLDSLTVPLADVKITGDSYIKNLGNNHIRFKGNIELFYLHPNRFNSIPEILTNIGMEASLPFVILRFVSWGAHHDIGEKGIPMEIKIKLVEMLKKKYSVFITSEKTLPKQLEKYQINFSPEKIHDVLAYASLYIGEGASMASEAACMGVPAIYINTLKVGYVQEEERYELVTSLRSPENLLSIVWEHMNDTSLKKKSAENLRNFLKEKIDPTAFLVWFIENYPESFRIMKEDPGFQEKFK